jgi:hypothetical protein
MKINVVNTEFSAQIVAKHGIVKNTWRRIMKDPINPDYYKNYSIEVTDAIQSWGLSYTKGNIIKYIVRSGFKTKDPKQDLEKALWYLQKELLQYGNIIKQNITKNNKQTKKNRSFTLSRSSQNLAKSNIQLRKHPTSVITNNKLKRISSKIIRKPL